VTLRYILDTTTVLEPLRPKPKPGLLLKLRRYESEIGISSVVWHHLRTGCSSLPRSRRRIALEKYLEEIILPSFPIIDYDRAAAEWHAVERTRLAKSGKVPSFVDGQVAAVAFVNDLVLVTKRRKAFEVFKGLRIQSWT
jgi:tRNA(fMet)-specific endonuclease VapC